MKYLILVLLYSFKTYYGISQTDSCRCVSEFNDLTKKTEEVYIAYHQKIKDDPDEKTKYEKFKKKLQNLASKASLTNCIDLMQRYTEYFNDGHFFVIENPEYDEGALMQFKTNIKKLKITEQEAKEYFDKNKKNLDAIEGLWYSENQAYKTAIVKNPTNKNEFLAVVLESTNPDWPSGYIKASFTKTATGYTSGYSAGNFTPARYKAAVYKSCILNIGASIYWGKSYPDDIKEQEYMDKQNAGRPTITRIDADNILVSIPSFLVEYSYMDSIVKAHREAIITTKNLIVDIRGNGGGNAIYFPLITLYYTHPYQDSMGKVLSSSYTIKYFEKQASYQRKQPGDTGLNIYERVLKDMQAHPGKIVDGPVYPENSSEEISALPEKVCILTDRACASAAESFIIHSKGFSNRVTTFGNNTYGMIDYTSINMISLLCKKQNYLFGYPTSTLHARIPKDGYNEAGIPPDVRIKEKEKNKIQFIVEWLKTVKYN